jgi:predicted SAM-dependent methyltransferase
LDAAKRFPCEDRQFDFVYSEHMLEHLSFESGASMLAECRRVLRPGGRLRVSTPDLAFVVGLYASHRSELQERYLLWAVGSESKSHLRPPPETDGVAPPAEVFVINNFMRDWGHQFIYDRRTLRYALLRAGFENITQCQIGESRLDALKGLEHETRLPDGFLRLETITMEGSTPSSSAASAIEGPKAKGLCL